MEGIIDRGRPSRTISNEIENVFKENALRSENNKRV